MPTEENTKLEFSNETVGTNVPKQFVPAVKNVSCGIRKNYEVCVLQRDLDF